MVVPEEETAAASRVAMTIHVVKQVSSMCPSKQQCLHSKDTLMLFVVWFAVTTVQVAAKRVRAVVAPSYAIRVQHRHNLEAEPSPHLCSSWVVREDKLQESIASKLPWRLPWMHTARHKTDLTTREAQRRLSSGRHVGSCAAQCLLHFSWKLISRAIFRNGIKSFCDRQHLYAPALRSPCHSLSAEVDTGACLGQIVMPTPALEVGQFCLLACTAICS
mmetsp:Transcript_9128/g.25535  ORF Transcript_9128/g.25535 Transcript_9128/m.25535 type:complete len:218 (-) Transcript_9128:896-1549(-)